MTTRQESQKGATAGRNAQLADIEYIVITGSRHWSDEAALRHALFAATLNSDRMVLIVGGAAGADTMAEQWAIEQGVKFRRMVPDWKTYGKAAGFRRNLDMLAFARQCADHARGLGHHAVASCYAFRAPGRSNGTDHTIQAALDAGMAVAVHNQDEPGEWDLYPGGDPDQVPSPE